MGYLQMFIACALAGNSVAWYNTAILLVCVKNFPRNRGPVVGLLKGYLGLSAAIFSAFCDFLFSGTASHFLLLLTIVPSTICGIAAPFLRPGPQAKNLKEESAERKNVFWFNVLATGLALYIIFVEVCTPRSTLAKRVYAGILSLLLVSPVLVPIIGLMDPLVNFFKKAATNLVSVAPSTYAIRKATHSNRRADDIENCEGDPLAEAKEPLLEAYDIHADGGDVKVVKSGVIVVGDRTGAAGGFMQTFVRRLCSRGIPELGEDRSFTHLLRSFDFWVFYVSCLCSGGAGLAFSNNLGQIGESIGFDSVTLFTSLFSIGGFAGRILSGLVSYL